MDLPHAPRLLGAHTTYGTLPYRHSSSTLTSESIPHHISTAVDLALDQLEDPESEGHWEDGPSRRAFDFYLQDKARPNRHPWAALRLFSTAPNVPAPSQRPRYVGGESVDGSVILDLKRSRSLISIFVLLRGRMALVSVPEKSHIFLEVTHTILDVSPDSSPSPPASHWGLSAPPGDGLSTGKFRGHHEWPFSIPFPTEIQYSLPGVKQRSRSKGGPHTYHTPQTISHQGIDVRITYEVVLKITTSGFWDTKHRITTPVLYVPLTVPPQLPVVRANAYLSGSDLVGPGDDPPGWQALTPMHLRVSRTDGQTPGDIDVECQLYISNPTIYTRGTVIPCYLICKSADSADPTARDLLDRFITQHSLALTFYQQVEYTEDPRLMLPTQSSKPTKNGCAPKASTCLTEDYGTAIWWTPTQPKAPPSNEPSTPVSHYLEGEIHLDGGLLPSCEVPFLTVSHFVAASLTPSPDIQVHIIYGPQRADPIPRVAPQRHAETASPDVEGILASYPVRIVTAHHPQDPTPVSYTVPPAPAEERYVE